jgi:EpsI family protein
MTRRCCLLAVLLLGAWALRARLTSPHVVAYAGALSQFPTLLSDWEGQDDPLETEVVKGTGTDDYVNRYYHSDSGLVSLYIAYYRTQKEGDAVHSPLNCLPGNGWQPIKTERISLNARPDATASTINRIIVEKGVDQSLVLYWYQTLNRVTASEYQSKAFLVADAFRSGRTDVAMVRIITPIEPREPDAEAAALSRARPFAERVLLQVQRTLFKS